MNESCSTEEKEISLTKTSHPKAAEKKKKKKDYKCLSVITYVVERKTIESIHMLSSNGCIHIDM
jgi:hypothetical protein